MLVSTGTPDGKLPHFGFTPTSSCTSTGGGDNNVSFIVSTIPPLDYALVLKKIADHLDTVTYKF